MGTQETQTKKPSFLALSLVSAVFLCETVVLYSVMSYSLQIQSAALNSDFVANNGDVTKCATALIPAVLFGAGGAVLDATGAVMDRVMGGSAKGLVTTVPLFLSGAAFGGLNIVLTP